MSAISAGVAFSPAQLARLLGVPEPTPEQAAVIAAPLEPVAVIAGAGSGKSETMAARLVWLVANGFVAPERVLGLTFTRKAAAELAGRVRARLDELRRAGLQGRLADHTGSTAAGAAVAAGRQVEAHGAVAVAVPMAAAAGEPAIATYHAYAGRLIADHALRDAVEPSVRLITPAVAWQIAHRVVAAYDGPMDETDWTPGTVTAAVIDLAGELAGHLRETGDVVAAGGWLADQFAALEPGERTAPAKIMKVQRLREQLLPLVQRFSAAKQAREVIDYDDQMAVAARIAVRHPEVGAAERARYQVVLLDEFQDTSHTQLELMRALFGDGHPVTAVGDPCQSIYGWRGASAGNLKRFAGTFRPAAPAAPAAGADRRAADATSRRAAVLPLSTSFRNTGRILDAAAALQAGLRASEPDVPRLAAPPGRAGRGQLTCALLDSATAEADWVAEQIAGLLRLPPGIAPDGEPWPDSRSDRLHPRDIAVLCRRRTQFAQLRAAIEAAGIPVEVVGLGGLLTVPDVADIVATLRVLHDPLASDALARLLTSPRWRVGPRDLVALGSRARELTAAVRPRRPAETGGNPEAPDLIARAVADFTAEPGSLVEAIDDPGNPGAYSAAGYARLTALAAELRVLRGHTGRPLPELVTEAERALGLDVEVASRPGRDPVAARADLDAFADAAAAFAGDADEPTLGAFLGYLEAAEAEEFGLEAGRVGESDSVKLSTVHSAKGLQWAAVLVPGLSAGPRAGNFPARPRISPAWTDNARLMPFWLRGDVADLPALAGLDPAALKAFSEACADRHLAEERRLGYVAVTRAAYWLGCSGYWWGAGKLPLGPSQFLDEIRAACLDGSGLVAHWAAPPAAEAANPALAVPLTVSWPLQPAAGDRHLAVTEAADLVRAADAGIAGTDAGPVARAAYGTSAVPASYAGLVTGWQADTELLLAERARRRSAGPARVELPRRLAVSSLVTLASEPAALAEQVRRPMPAPPAPQARRGTAFHRWLEERFGQPWLIDPDELPGAAEDGELPDLALAALAASFEASEWGRRWPAAIEVPFETRIGDRLVRGRIDAIFADGAAGGYDVVDWKTGQPPRSAAALAAAGVQLAAYRLAWADLAAVPVGQVRAAFYYVRDDLTVRPADLLDEAGLAALLESIPESR